jgi:hypothetical protein
MGPIGVKYRVSVLSSHFVTSPDCICGMDSPLLGCAERSSPKAARGAPKARGLDGEGAVRAIIIVAATYKGHSALFEALWMAIVGPLPFTDMSSLAA